jgi:hypothetical protein
MPLELPGRNSRMMEPKQTSMTVLVMDVVAALTPLLGRVSDPDSEQPPFALLGHSMGAWLVYEVAKVLQARGLPLPVKLYVVANRAPHLAGWENDVDQLAPRLGMLSPQQFWCDHNTPTPPAVWVRCSPRFHPASGRDAGPTSSAGMAETQIYRTQASATTSYRCYRRTSCCWRRSSLRTHSSSLSLVT